jgi:acyl-coenzyme A synthetase/AMP-(fatty) acid ligase
VWEIPERFNIGAACTDAHLDTGAADRAAVILDDDARGVRALTFRELARETDRFAQLLRDLGVAAGERLLIRLPNCLEYPVVFLGALKRAAIPVPTSMLLTADEVVWLAEDSGAAVLVTDHASRTALQGRLPGIRRVLVAEELEAALAAVGECGAAEPTRADDPAYLVYTSGISGYPKGVLHAHRALLGRQPSSTYWFDFLPAGDRVLHAGKLNWTYVLGTGLTDPLYRGHTAILHEGANDPAVWPHLIARHRATTFIAVPTVYRQIVQRTTAVRGDVPTLRHCMCAGEPLSDELLAAWRERFGLDLHEGLGMTECSYYICQPKGRPLRPGSAGFIQPGHDVKLLDPTTWREVGVGEEGMLCIPRRDPALCLGYWNQPEETAASFHGDWFLTGDYARRDADGYVWFLGRRDDLIKSFGYRVSPHEVERVLEGHSDVADAAVVGEQVGPGKVVVAAYVISRAGSTTTADDLLAWGRQRLAAYKAPRIVYLVADLPRTRNGKVLRRQLTPALAHARSGADGAGAARPPAG